jgi:hypothetical protein
MSPQAPLRFFNGAVKVIKGLTARTLQMDYDQTAMGSPLFTSAVFLIAQSFWQME